MPAEWSRLLARLSRTDLQKLLEAKADIEELEARRSALLKELASIEKCLKQLAVGELGRGRPGAGRAAKAGGIKKRTTKKSAPKRSKMGGPAVKAQKGPRPGRRAKKSASKVAPARGEKSGAADHKKTSGGAGARMKLEDLVVAVLRKHGKPMPFKVLLETIVKDKRFNSRSNNFENVLRRTLSTSEYIQRKERGVYGI